MENIVAFVEFCLVAAILYEAVLLYMVVKIVMCKEDLSMQGILEKRLLHYSAMTADAIKAKTSNIYYLAFQF